MRSRFLLNVVCLLFSFIFTQNTITFGEDSVFKNQFKSNLELGSSWSGTNKVEEDEGIFVLKGSQGKLEYHHQLKEFQLAFKFLIPEINKTVLRISLPSNGIASNGRSILFKKDHVVLKESKLKQKYEYKQKGNETSWVSVEMKILNEVLTLTINGHKSIYQLKSEQSGRLSIGWLNSSKSNIKIKNLELSETEYKSLFNGMDFTGWVGAGAPAEKCWKVENGILEGLRTKGPYLRSNQEYDDFSFRLEYKVEAGANSGVFIRVPANGKHHRKKMGEPAAGYEVQLLDDYAEKYKHLREYQFSASLYDVMGVNRLVGKRAGEWNSLEIICDTDRIITVHNGVKVVDAKMEEYPLMFLRNKKGFLGLQNHGGGVSLRNMRIGPPTIYE